MQKHELNTDFTWRDHEGPFRRVSEAQAQQYDQDGFFVLEDAFPPEAVAGLLAEGGEMTIGGTQCMDSVWPDFFETLHLLKETKR